MPSSKIKQLAPAPKPGVHPARWSHAWRALRHPNFRLFFLGQSVSVVGTWLTQVARGWLVYELTHSALLLGVVSFVGQIVSFVTGPFAGVWVERLDRRKLMIWTQSIGALQSLFMAVVTLAHVVTVWQIMVLSVVAGVVGALAVPARLSFVANMVEDPNDIDNGVALVTSMNNVARLVGPAIAGLVIAAWGEGWCFLIDALSFLPVIASLARMRMNQQATRRSGGMLEEMREGWSYVSSYLPIRVLLTFVALVSLMGNSYAVLLPVFASSVLHGGPTTLGWLTGASGIGALMSTFLLAIRKSVVGLASVVQIAGALLGLALILFGWSHVLWLSLPLMTLIGFGLMQSVTGVNTILQSLVPEDMRGRVMSYYAMAFLGAAPFGNLLVSALAARLGSPTAVGLFGAACFASSVWLALQLPKVSAAMSAIYVQKGLLDGTDPANCRID